jgi:hypothetical protein
MKMYSVLFRHANRFIQYIECVLETTHLLPIKAESFENERSFQPHVAPLFMIGIICPLPLPVHLFIAKNCRIGVRSVQRLSSV